MQMGRQLETSLALEKKDWQPILGQSHSRLGTFCPAKPPCLLQDCGRLRRLVHSKHMAPNQPNYDPGSVLLIAENAYVTMGVL
jgi:hypothetical protein